ARNWCDACGAILVEDAAHVLAPVPGVGERGDFVLYSPHKLLPVPDGALLVVRERAKRLEPWVVKALRAIGGAHPHTQAWRLKRLIQKTPLGWLLARFRQGGQADFLSDPAAGPLPPTPMPSAAGAALLARAELAAAAHRRQENAAALAQAIRAPKLWERLFPACNEFAPYRLVMRCTDPDRAAELYTRLRAARLPVESWPDLPPEVTSGTALDLRRTLLLLPCHQSLSANSLAQAYAQAVGVGR
ncbi:MAG: hypothetical protein K2X44_06300, partial [Magnetospirillum sp.]|nr:hypothetical protein [Magnetospirillum sp.]